METDVSEQGASRAAGRGAEPSGSLRILLAEDNKHVRALVTLLLQKRGHAVTCAENGREAVACLVRESFDCVLMDISMPVMDGLEATRTIRESATDRVDAGVPILALTAYEGEDEVRRFLDAGMDGYVQKPVQPAVLFRALADAVAGRTGDAAPAAAAAPARDGRLLADPGAVARDFCMEPWEMRAMAERVLHELPGLLAAAEAAAAHGDAAAVARAAHALAGSSAGMLAADAESGPIAAARGLEGAAREALEAGERADFGARIAALRGSVECFLDELRRWLEAGA